MKNINNKIADASCFVYFDFHRLLPRLVSIEVCCHVFHGCCFVCVYFFSSCALGLVEFILITDMSNLAENSGYIHSVKVPKIYKISSKIVQTVVEQGGSIKQLLYTTVKAVSTPI